MFTLLDIELFYSFPFTVFISFIKKCIHLFVKELLLYPGRLFLPVVGFHCALQWKHIILVIVDCVFALNLGIWVLPLLSVCSVPWFLLTFLVLRRVWLLCVGW